MPNPPTKLLIANRGEIAIRVARTARALGYPTVAVYSAADRDAAHVRAAGEAVYLGPAAPAESYLSIERLLDAAARTGADAVHPGYGFLAENADFARACRDAGLVFVGPDPEVIELMGDKARARARMSAAHVPVVPGSREGEVTDDQLRDAAREIGYPLLVKAVAGGGGRGMRRVDAPEELDEALARCRSEARGAFGNDDLFLERLLQEARHVEVQIFGDRHGSIVHLGERDCSLQRRHQKVVEESPSPAVGDDLRRRLGEAAVAAGEAVGYAGAGTVEFLLDAEGAFYFMEMNTRLQVEHPVTEMVTGLDLVAWQLKVAAGEPLPLAQDEISFAGHAIEARLYAEDPAAGFLPQPGRVFSFHPPRVEGVRFDSGLADAGEIPAEYDPLIAKAVAHGATREEARRRLLLALGETVLLGPVTNRRFLERALRDPVFVAGEVTTGFAERDIAPEELAPPAPEPAILALAAVLLSTAPDAGELAGWSSSGASGWPLRLDGDPPAELYVEPAGPRRHRVSIADASVQVEVLELTEDRVRCEADGVQRTLALRRDGDAVLLDDRGVCRRFAAATRQAAARSGEGDGRVLAPMSGRIQAVHAASGQNVASGDALVVLEAMKLETPVRAPFSGTVQEILVEEGEQVEHRQLLAVLAPEENPG